MKKIKYAGTLTEDIKLVNNKDKEPNIFRKLFFTSKVVLFGYVIIIPLMLICTKANIAMITSITSAFATLTMINSSKTFLNVTREGNKRKAISRIIDLVWDLSKEDAENIDSVDEVYTFEDLAEAVVIETEKKVDEKDQLMNDYIEEITSDIYIINNKDKIRVLREVKKSINGKKQLSPFVSCVSLHELEESELPPRSKLPVKQVLRIKSERKKY